MFQPVGVGNPTWDFYEAAMLFIHNTSQLDVWRASTKVNLFIPKVPPHKNNLQNLGIRKVIHQSSFLVNPPPRPFLSFFFLKDPPCILDDGESFVEKNIKKHRCRGVSFTPKVRNNLFFFRFGGRFSDYAKKRKALKLAREKAASRSCQGWKSQVEVSGGLLGGGVFFLLLVIFFGWGRWGPGISNKKGGEVMVVDFSEMRIFGVIWRYQKFSQPRWGVVFFQSGKNSCILLNGKEFCCA